MSVWIAGGAAILGAGAQYYGSKKNADAIEDAGDAATAFQRDVFNTQIALARPQLEVGNSALGVLASLFGLKQPSQIDFDNIGGGGAGHPLYGDGNQPLNAAGVTQAYRDIFGREPDPEGLQYHLTGGPKEGASRGLHAISNPLEEALGFGGGSDGKRRSFTYNELAQAFRASPEYQEKKARGILPPTEAGGQYSQNFTGAELSDEGRSLLEQSQQEQQAAAAPAAGLDLNQLVTDNPLIKFNREQGEQAIARGAAARGLNQSGGTLKDLTTFNQDLSGAGVQQFVLDPLFQLAGFGPQASNQLSAQAGQTGTNLANIALDTGAARGSAYQNAGNTFGNLISDIGGAYATRNYRGNNPQNNLYTNLIWPGGRG